MRAVLKNCSFLFFLYSSQFWNYMWIFFQTNFLTKKKNEFFCRFYEKFNKAALFTLKRGDSRDLENLQHPFNGFLNKINSMLQWESRDSQSIYYICYIIETINKTADIYFGIEIILMLLVIHVCGTHRCV